MNRRNFAFKVLTSEWKRPHLETLMNKLFFQKDHNGFQQLKPGTDHCVEATKALAVSRFLFFKRDVKLGTLQRKSEITTKY